MISGGDSHGGRELLIKNTEKFYITIKQMYITLKLKCKYKRKFTNLIYSLCFIGCVYGTQMNTVTLFSARY